MHFRVSLLRVHKSPCVFIPTNNTRNEQPASSSPTSDSPRWRTGCRSACWHRCCKGGSRSGEGMSKGIFVKVCTVCMKSIRCFIHGMVIVIHGRHSADKDCATSIVEHLLECNNYNGVAQFLCRRRYGILRRLQMHVPNLVKQPPIKGTSF